MCNFHSICGRMLGQTPELLHAAHNSHSQMISEAKWRENKPNETVRVFEAEWDGRGAFPSDNKLIRNADECPEKLKSKIRHHFQKLQTAITTGKLFDSYFADCEKYSDVYGEAMNRGVSVKFPKKVGNLYLGSLTSIPEGLKLPDSIGGYLYLGSLTSIPEGLKLPDSIGGNLDLGSLTSIPEGLKLPDSIGGYLYLGRLTSIPEGLKLPDSIGGYLDLGSLTSIPEGLKLPDSIGGNLDLGRLDKKSRERFATKYGAHKII